MVALPPTLRHAVRLAELFRSSSSCQRCHHLYDGPAYGFDGQGGRKAAKYHRKSDLSLDSGRDTAELSGQREISAQPGGAARVGDAAEPEGFTGDFPGAGGTPPARAVG